MTAHTYRLIIKPLSSFVTPLQSDTIFGHIAWTIAYNEKKAEETLRNLLDEFKKAPPFIVSSGFPHGKLPIPILKPLSHEDKEKISSDVVELAENLTAVNMIDFLPIEELKKITNNVSNRELLNILISNKEAFRSDNKNCVDEKIIMRTAVDRITGAALEEALYDSKECFFTSMIDIWIRFYNLDYIEKLQRWFNCLEYEGFGANLSTGSGQFEIVSFNEENNLLPETAEPNAFMTISHFSPQKGDPTDGYYQHRVKRGKVGGLWSVAGFDGKSKPHVWKYPLIMFDPGSVFKVLPGEQINKCYGRIVENIHPKKQEICQYALAFPVGLRINDD